MVASMGATGAVAVGVLLLVVGAARAEGGGMAHLDRVGVRGAAFGGRRLANALNADGNAAKPGGVWQMPVGRLPVDKSVRGRRMKGTAPLEEAPIYGDFRQLAYYYLDAFIGTPPQRFSVIADTGSSLLSVPCAGCTTCGAHMNPKYDISKSSTARPLSCTDSACTGLAGATCTNSRCSFYQRYTSGSFLSGYYNEDQLWIGGNSSTVAEGKQYGVQFAFGCGTAEGGIFVTQRADGIIGMSRSRDTFVAKLHSAGTIDSFLFSMCFKTEGGVINIGGYDPRLHEGQLLWATLTSGETYHSIFIDNVGVQSTVVGGGHSAIIDSGTSFTYISSSIYSSFMAGIQSFCNQTGNCLGTKVAVPLEDLCYRLAQPSDINTFPSVSFRIAGPKFADVELVVPPEFVFMNMTWNSGAYCIGIYSNAVSSTVVGANAMQSHDFVFDVSNSRVGIAKSSCVLPPDDGSSSQTAGSETTSESIPERNE